VREIRADRQSLPGARSYQSARVETAKIATAIAIAGVSQRFGARAGAAETLALDDVSLQIERGEFVALLGPSGCGKSTLLNIIGGLLAPSAGTVTVGETHVRGPLPRDMAFVFQESTLLPWYTVLDNFRVSFEFQGRAGEWRERALAALRSVGMEQFANHFPGALSIGMKQRINLARGISLETGIVLMDEPFAALDEQTRLVLGEDLSVLLARTGKTIVFVTHSLAEAVFLADRIVVMTARPGKIKALIAVEEPHPRSPDFMLTPRFSQVRNQLYELLRDEIRATVDAMREARDAPAR
jgi:NitT/TauT family transport system ATP-binding protein